MWRYLSVVPFLVLAAANPASAGLVLVTELVDSTATSHTYGVKLIGATNLATYNVEVIIQAGGLTDESQVVAEPPASGYIFDDSMFFFAGVNVVGPEVRVTLSDFLLTGVGVDTVAGINDLLALITIDTSALTSQPILNFEADSLILDTPEHEPIAGFDELKRSLEAVPEPSSALLALFGGGVILGAGAIRRGCIGSP